MKLPKVTNKQQEIIKLLYRYRFLNRIQIQKLMNHKDYKTINLWLKDLTEKQFLNRIYSTHFLEKSKPAIYYLGINSIRFLKQQTDVTEDDQGYPTYPITELRKRYRERQRSENLRSHSILIAECCINLKSKTSQRLSYGLATQADYIDPNHGYHFLSGAEGITPDLCIIKHEYSANQKNNPTADDEDVPGTITNYLLQIFDSTLPQYRIRNTLKQYVNYLNNDGWESGDNDPAPVVLLVCPRVTDLIYAKRRTRKLLLDEYYDFEDIPKDLHIRFTTTEQLKQEGINSPIWEEYRRRYDV